MELIKTSASNRADGERELHKNFEIEQKIGVSLEIRTISRRYFQTAGKLISRRFNE